jgi:phytoene dehydrogenase-like protein
MYDALIIGAGMSGLAAGIRLTMFGQKVCLLERHYAVGGLNSYYRLNDRNYDVGLHALTNFAPRGAKQGPLPRLLRQLRIPWDDLELAEQIGSEIRFPSAQLRFNNEAQFFEAEIDRVFPDERDNYQRLLKQLLDYDQLTLPEATKSARQILATTFSNPLVAEMLICPALFYGGAREHDLDWGSFSVLFRAIFLEGLARPRGGIRVILKQLVRRFKELGGELRLRAGVKRIVRQDDRAVGVELDDGEEISARQIISSAGWNETIRLCERSEGAGDACQVGQPGRMTFLETICTLDCQPRDLGFGQTIVFYSDADRFEYACPPDFANLHSGIICSPNNYQYGDGSSKIEPSEGTLRLTALANFDHWAALAPDEYPAQKHIWFEQLVESASRVVPDLKAHIVDHDTFTPTTLVRYTGHDQGAVYGAPEKHYDGRTPLENVFICGADQGYVGIVGTLTSGIQIANTILRQSASTSASSV